MFQIEKLPTKSPYGNDRQVVDHDRQVSLQFIKANMFQGGNLVMKLIWDERVIHFEVETTNYNHNEYYVNRFINFGSNPDAERAEGIKPYVFKDEHEKQQALLLATEAILHYGSYYNGEKFPDGPFLVELNGKMYRKSDF